MRFNDGTAVNQQSVRHTNHRSDSDTTLLQEAHWSTLFPLPLQGTISYYQIMHVQTAPLPVHYQTLCESSKLYDPGQQYAAHVKDLQMPGEPETHYVFEPYSAPCSQ